MKQNYLTEQIYYSKNDIRKETIIQRLRENGCRITKQREILLGVILGQECTSCKEMYYKAHAIDSSIGVATVYRMVNALEKIGVFSRKNLYKISNGMESDKEEVCMITFEDHTCCRLSAKAWYEVISAGLKVCGYGRGKKVKSIEVGLCKKTPNK